MESSVEDHMLEIHKLVINKWRESAFPTGVKDDGAAHKEHLQSILFHPDITMLAVPKTYDCFVELTNSTRRRVDSTELKTI
eukprot:2414728-Rhodomonas_salina.1